MTNVKTTLGITSSIAQNNATVIGMFFRKGKSLYFIDRKTSGVQSQTMAGNVYK